MPTLEAIRQLLAGGESLEFTVTGNSMGASLPPGSQVRVAGRAPGWGELVLYDYGGGAALHRAVFKRGGRVYQLGDAEPGGSWLAPAQIFGAGVALRLPGEEWRKESSLRRLSGLLRGWTKLALRKLRHPRRKMAG